jgi:hypothetical protein
MISGLIPLRSPRSVLCTCGAGELEAGAEIDNRFEERNSVFFPLIATAITRAAPNEAVAYVRRMAAVPDSSFFEITSEFRARNRSDPFQQA